MRKTYEWIDEQYRLRQPGKQMEPPTEGPARERSTDPERAQATPVLVASES
jgi:hypothetical protein